MRDFRTWEPSKTDLLWMRTILQYLPLDRTIITQDVVAERAHMSKDLLIRFMNGTKTVKPETDFEHARKVAPVLAQVCRDELIKSTKLDCLRSVIFDLFPELHAEVGAAVAEQTAAEALAPAESQTLKPRAQRIIQDENVRSTVLPVGIDAENHDRAMEKLHGLWLLIRPASNGVGETVSIEETERYSLSLLNILSQDLDRGRYPFFKIRQGGDAARRRAPFTFTGVVVPHAQRALFVGRLRTPERLFAMTASYVIDHESTQHLSQINGVMLGITSHTLNVASPHVCFFIPGTETLSDEAFEAADQMYRQQIGTKTEEDLRKVLENAGTEVDDEAWNHVKVGFRARRSFTDD